VPLAVRLNASVDVVGVANVMLGAWMSSRLVRLIEVDQIATLERRRRG
jgi:hypothetical protein